MMKQNNSNEKKTSEKTASNNVGHGKKARKATQRKKTSDTFWNLLRVKSDMKLKDIAEATGFKVTSISNWFTGKTMPDNYTIRVICDWFGIPFEKGELEFKNGYTVFHGTHGTIDKEPRKATKMTLKDLEEYCSNTVPVEEEIKPISEEVKIDAHDKADRNIVLAQLFDVMSFEEYMEIVDNYDSIDSTKILDRLYGMVSRKTYEEVQRALHVI